MISKQKNIVIFFISLLLFFFSLVSDARASGIHTFSINNEGKYFIDYRDGLDPNTVQIFRNIIIKMMPALDEWGSTSIDKLEIAIVPDSFDDYQIAYKNTEIWKIMDITTKDRFDGVTGSARSERKKIIIKESAFNNTTFYHESCHLIQYPFEFDQYFSEGQANVCSMFVNKALGGSDVLRSFRVDIKAAYDKLSPQERKIYGTKLRSDGAVTVLHYQVGETFIEKLLAKAGVDNLSQLFMNLRSDFSEVAKKYEDYPLAPSYLAAKGQELPLPNFGILFFNSDGQEIIMCEAIKAYGDKVVSVFPEFGFSPPTNCHAKIEAFKKAKMDEFDNRMAMIKSGKFLGREIIADKKSVLQATESDKWIGSEVVKNENYPKPLNIWIQRIIALAIIATIFLLIVFLKRRRGKLK
ncbi:MAG: hypothetical protein WCV59_02340 [Parcubacteria group bacterium]|jgi:hypothetical protein